MAADSARLVGKAVGLAAWGVVTEKLCLPSLLRLSELFVLNTESLLGSDAILVALALAVCPVDGVRHLLHLRDYKAKAAAAVAGALVGWQNVRARKGRRDKLNQQSVQIASDDNSAVWRNSQCPGGELMTEVYPEVTTLYHNFFVHARTRYPQAECLGCRVPGGYTWTSYGDVAARAEAFGAGLLGLGIQPGQKVGVYSVNNTEWVLAELGGYAYGVVNVALYATLGDEQLAYVVKHSEMSAVVCHMEVLSALLTIIPNCVNVKFIIFMDGETEQSPSNEQLRLAGAAGTRLLPFSEVERMGRDNPPDHIPPRPEDLATIMYTSGTTGNPKGVMLSHQNVLANGTVYPVIVERVGVALGPGDRYISYLPLAHIFERSALATMFAQGVAVGFYAGKTESLVDDIAVLRPTVLFGVPRVFNRVHDRVVQMVEKGSRLKRFLFNTALKESTKARVSACGPEATTIQAKVPLWDKLVFSKVRARLGGCCRIIVSGGAPLGSSTQEFLSSAFGCPAIQGYGLTETSASGSFSLIEDPKTGHVGPPSPCLDLKLVDVEEMGYSVRDEPHPRGEVCFKGASVMRGYYKEVGMTLEVMENEWFHTGDIGQVNADGTLSIIDRKKNIFKLSQGEYVAAERLEVQYASSKMVSQIFVYGDSLQSVLVAVVVPEHGALAAWAKSAGLLDQEGPGADQMSLAALCSLPGAEKAVLDELKSTAKAQKMKGFEVVRGVILESDAFAVENNLMTPTFKLKRPQLKAKYKSQIDILYEKLS